MVLVELWYMILCICMVYSVFYSIGNIKAKQQFRYVYLFLQLSPFRSQLGEMVLIRI